jgi:uncharacterized membrane protein
MKKIGQLLMKGLAALLPIGLTLYIVIWLGSATEAVMRDLVTLVLPERYYWPGLGLVVGFALLVTVGIFVNAFLVRWFLAAWGRFLERIPLVKTVFGAIRDLVKILPAGGKRRDLQRVVLASFGDARIIGFVTREDVSDILGSGSDGIVAVYFPMSYQIGGYTAYMPRDRLETLDLGVEEAMRLVLTGGVSGVNAPAGPSPR